MLPTRDMFSQDNVFGICRAEREPEDRTILLRVEESENAETTGWLCEEDHGISNALDLKTDTKVSCFYSLGSLYLQTSIVSPARPYVPL